jgi:hypothetical protein
MKKFFGKCLYWFLVFVALVAIQLLRFIFLFMGEKVKTVEVNGQQVYPITHPWERYSVLFLYLLWHPNLELIRLL